MIPKIIHYCWLSNEPIPEKFENYISGWKKILNDYEFILWDFNRFPKEKSIWVKEAFDNKKYAFACDYIRLDAVYNYGGIYMDMDIEVIKKFDPMLKKPYMFAYERPNSPWIEAGCFGAESHNEFISKCLDYYSNRHFVNNKGEFDQTPLPQIMCKIQQENKIKLDCYPCDYFTAKSFDTGLIKCTDNTYAIHHFAGSWKTDIEKKVIEDSQKFSRIFGRKIGGNIAQYKMAAKTNGLNGIIKLTSEKLSRKIK